MSHLTTAPLRRYLSAASNALAASLVLASLSLSPLRADEVRLDDGRVLVGKVAKKGEDLEITTRDGVVIVPAARVTAIRSDEDLRRELATKAKAADGSAFASLHLAAQAHAWGLEKELWRYLDAALERNAAPAKGGDDADAARERRQAVDRRIRDLLAQLEPEVLPRKYVQASTAARVHALLDQVRPSTGRAQRAAIIELLVREQNADADLRREARRNSSDRERLAAVEALQARPAAGNDRFVWRTAIIDRDKDVREGAIGLVPTTQAAAVVSYLAPGLMHQAAEVRVRTAEAFGNLGHRDALPLLVAAAPSANTAVAGGGGGNGGVRGHIAILNQQAYIRDFDVEVASASFIADPKIDVLASGTVLDVTVVGVSEVRMVLQAYRRALGKVAASDPGDNPTKWPAWLASVNEASSIDKASKAATTPGR
ncbi:MAG: hypothetical protein H6838_16655 [Planctomycetes bacterium]|nr:hypothetical protein [Planctomycetota bacterium]MCB9887125.1 hypothetical protein [Planctomycetota bacterium]